MVSNSELHLLQDTYYLCKHDIKGQSYQGNYYISS